MKAKVTILSMEDLFPNRRKNSFLFTTILSSLLMISVYAERQCYNPQDTAQVPQTDPDNCPVQGGSQNDLYCCPDYQCCTQQEINAVANNCPCPQGQKCCDGYTCCTDLESEKLSSKCSNVGSLCDGDNFSRLRCCHNAGLVSEGVCCTPVQQQYIGARCFNDNDCPNDMECHEGECRFNITFDETEMALFIILGIAAIVTVIVIALQALCYVIYKMKKNKREAKRQAYKPPEVTQINRPPGEKVVVQIPVPSQQRRTPTQMGGNINAAFSRSSEQIYITQMENYEREPMSGSRRMPSSTSQNFQDLTRDPYTKNQQDKGHIWATDSSGKPSWPQGSQNDVRERPPQYRRNMDPANMRQQPMQMTRNNNFNANAGAGGKVNHGYRNSTDGDTLRSYEQRYPLPPPRNHTSYQATSSHYNSQQQPTRFKNESNKMSEMNHSKVPQNGRYVIEVEDENDTLVIGSDSMRTDIVSPPTVREVYEDQEQRYVRRSQERDFQFGVEERNIDNPDTPVENGL